MILAINVNAALDRISFIPRFVPSTNMRAQKSVLSVGGKGLDTALVLKTLGAPVQAITFIAGKNGEILADLLNENRINCHFIWLPGETRVANVIVETDFNRHSHITTSGYTVTPVDCDAFLSKIDEYAPLVKWAVIAGSLPAGAPVSFYRQIIEKLHEFGVKVLIDNVGQPLLETLPACPEVVKMNQDEFQETFKIQAGDMDEWVTVCREQMERHGIQSLIITCGKDGILAFTPEGTFLAGSAEVKEVNAAGAGDAVSGALTYRLMLGDSWTQALLWCAATSAAVVRTEGTAVCYMPDILEIYPNGWVKKIC